MKKIILTALIFIAIKSFGQKDPPGLIYSCQINSEKDSKYAIFNSNGDRILSFDVDWAFSNGWSWIIVVNRKSNLITVYNFSGEKILDSVEDINSVYLNLSRVAIKKNGKWGFYNRLGEIKVAHTYDEVSHFYQNKAAVKLGQNIFIIDTNGVKLDVAYNGDDRHYSFEDSDIALGMGGEFYYPNYKKVIKNGKAGLLEVATNKFVIPAEYDDLVDIKDKRRLITGKRDGKCGLLNFEGQTVIPFKYISVFVLNDYFE